MDEALRNFSYLKKDGVCIINSPQKYSFPEGYSIACFDTQAMAQKNFGKHIFSGQILLGMLIKSFPEIFPQEKTIDLLKGFKRINIDALKAGMDLV